MPTDHELVLTPTKVLTEGTGTSHAPYIVAPDLSSGQSFIAWSDNDDASYGKCDASRSSRGNYPLWSDVDPSIDPSWVTAIGVRFRALTPSVDAVAHFVVQLFGQTSRLLSDPFIGSEVPLVFAAANTWEDFDYVVADVDYDAAGWAPTGVQSALAETFIYCRTKPTDVTGEFNGTGVLEISEQSIVIYYTVPDDGTIDTPCDTWVDLDLSTAVQTEGPEGPWGQYVDGVITGLNGNPDFWFPFESEASKPYAIEVTFDPDSSHDGGGDLDRGVTIAGWIPGSEDSSAGITTDFPVFYEVGDTPPQANVVQSFTIGPGRPRSPDAFFQYPDNPTWDDPDSGVAAGFTRLWFETARDGAVSAIRIRKICTSSVPPLRLTNRDDQFSSAPRLAGRRSRQGSVRLTGYL